MAKSYRKERINERIKELLGDLILTQVKDPRIGLVSITSVKVAPDLATAKVYFIVMGDEEIKAETRKGLISAKNYLRTAIGRELKFRQAPDLRFVYDDTLERAMRIEDAIVRIRNEGDSDSEIVDDSRDGSETIEDSDGDSDGNEGVDDVELDSDATGDIDDPGQRPGKE